MNIQTEIQAVYEGKMWKSKIKEKGFKSVTITIDIVTEEELCDLWLRLNVSNARTKEANKLHDLKHDLLEGSGQIMTFWKAIDNLITKFGLRGKQYERNV